MKNRKSYLILIFCLIFLSKLLSEDNVNLSEYENIAQDKKTENRQKAIDELSQIKTEGSARVLSKFFNDKKFKLKKKALKAVIDMNLSENIEIILIQAKDKDEEIREMVFSSLKKYDDEKVLNAYLIALDDKEIKIRQIVLENAITLGKKGIPILIKALKNEANSIVNKAIVAIVNLNEEQSIKELSLVINSDNKEIRQQAIIYAGVSGNEFFIPDLFKIFDKKKIEDKILALNSLAYIGTKNAAKTILLAINDKSVTVRKNAIILLGTLGYFDITETLAEQLLIEKDDIIRKEIIKALANIGDKKAIPFIEKKMLETKVISEKIYIDSIATIINKNKGIIKNNSDKIDKSEFVYEIEKIKNEYEEKINKIKKENEENILKINNEFSVKEEKSKNNLEEISKNLLEEMNFLYSIDEKTAIKNLAIFGIENFSDKKEFRDYLDKINNELKAEEDKKINEEKAKKEQEIQSDNKNKTNTKKPKKQPVTQKNTTLKIK